MDEHFTTATREAGVEAAETALSIIRKELEQAGITSEYLITKLKEELEATQVRVFHYQGALTEDEPRVAWEIRQKARQDAHKLRSDYPAEKVEHSFLKTEADRLVQGLQKAADAITDAKPAE